MPHQMREFGGQEEDAAVLAGLLLIDWKEHSVLDAAPRASSGREVRGAPQQLR